MAFELYVDCGVVLVLTEGQHREGAGIRPAETGDGTPRDQTAATEVGERIVPDPCFRIHSFFIVVLKAHVYHQSVSHMF